MKGRLPPATTIIGALVLSCSVVASSAVADIGPPAHLQVTERERGVFSVRWRVPDVLPPNAVPTPMLPPGCEPEGDVDVTRSAGAWLFAQTWVCSASLAGGEVGLRFPFPDLALTTVARVDLLSGDRYARLLTPGEPPWRLPEGTVVVDPLGAARSAVLLGAAHVAGGLAHLALIVAVALLGRVRRPLWLLGMFTGGQVAGALVVAVAGRGFAPGFGELSVGLAAALLARETLFPAAQRRRLLVLSGTSGILHGLTVDSLIAARLGEAATSLPASLIAILGMDGAQLIGAYGVFLLLAVAAEKRRRAALDSLIGGSPGSGAPTAGGRQAVLRRMLAHGAGIFAAAAALAAALAGSGIAEAGRPGAARLASPPIPTASAAPAASQRLAPAAPALPVQSFLAIEPFELRHEVMLRLGDLAAVLGLDPEATLDVDAQPAVVELLTGLVLERTSLSADGAVIEPNVRSVDFMSVDPTGALPRANPRPEPVAAAIVGVVVVYPTGGMPRRVALSWRPFPDFVAEIPATLIDPEVVRTIALSAGQDTVTWNNELLDDPIPAITAVPVEPVKLPVPWLALPLFAVAAWAAARSLRGGRRAEAAAASRIALALALVVGPMAATSVALPGSGGRLPSDVQARRLLAGLLPNVYRALEFRDEGRIYDRLAVTVTGDALTDIYLQQRRALELEERGGAVARVEAVEVLEAGGIEALPDGFRVRSAWTVGGMVTHFGHRHFRQNRYDARVGVVAVDGTWKIRAIEVLEQERVQ
jgi:hypothetical protein